MYTLGQSIEETHVERQWNSTMSFLGLRSALAELYNNTVSHVTDNIITA